MRSVQDNPDALAGLDHDATLFEEVIYWSRKLSPVELESIQADPRCLAIPMIKLVIADWLAVSKYMTTRLGIIEWEIEEPHWGENPREMDILMKKLAPWRRNIGYYQTMVNEAIARLFPSLSQTPLDMAALTDPLGNAALSSSPRGSDSRSQLLSLWPDFKIVKQNMADCHARIMSIQNTATNAINIEESRRAITQNNNALKQNKELGRLTFLATIFIPLNFTSSFLSMSPDFFNATRTVWLFFVLGVPITLTALIVVDLNRSEENTSICKKLWRKLYTNTERDENTAAEARPNLGRGATIPWALGRNPSSRGLK